MIIFLLHLAIAGILAYVVIRSIVETGRKDLVIPIAGIITIFLIHCISFGETCLQCNITSPKCMGELFMFWFFAGWAIIRLVWRK
ncbi:MAG: hypothetical protein GXN93_01735 [Candidatus Diapherotrites archaeon]|nr:hypothetical protein [Candidatus Diapherotrites archaeon]